MILSPARLIQPRPRFPRSFPGKIFVNGPNLKSGNGDSAGAVLKIIVHRGFTIARDDFVTQAQLDLDTRGRCCDERAYEAFVGERFRADDPTILGSLSIYARLRISFSSTFSEYRIPARLFPKRDYDRVPARVESCFPGRAANYLSTV